MNRNPILNYGYTVGGDPHLDADLTECVDTWPLVRHRDMFYGCSGPVTAQNSSGGDACTTIVIPGDVIAIRIPHDYIFYPFVQSEFPTIDEDLREEAALPQNCAMEGRVVTSWGSLRKATMRPVGFDAYTTTLSTYEQYIVEAFTFDANIASVSTELCKEGDRFIMLRPPDMSREGGFRIVVIHRFLIDTGKEPRLICVIRLPITHDTRE